MINRSRYDDDMKIRQDDNVLYERREPIELESGDEVIKYRTNEDEELTDIAYTLYKDATLWWVIADVLNVNNPFNSLKLKTNIIILPTLKTVTERIL